MRKSNGSIGVYMALLSFMILVLSCKTPDKAQESETRSEDLLSYVNPFIGTAPLTDPAFIGYTPPEGWRVWAGLTYPGATLPNAMVQLSPITKYGSGAGYEYEDFEIIGFTHTNKGHWNLCHIPVLPLAENAKAPFKSNFRKETEKASPGYYSVYLDDYKVKVELTTSLRGGFHKYTFDDNKVHKVLFDLSRANNRVDEWHIEKAGTNAVEGYQRTGGDKVHFYAEFNETVQNLETTKEGKRDGYSIVILDAEDQPVTLKIGLSFVSIANAKENFQKELSNRDFETVHKDAKDVWSKVLNKIQVSGGTEKEKELFYSSLYRSMQWPALRSDANGEFKDEAGKVQNKGFRYYTNPSLWDTYRNKLVLLSLLSPEVTGDIIQSLVDKGSYSGFMPTFFHGDHAAPFVAQAYGKGITNFDVKKAYELLLNNAYKAGGTRPYIEEYIEKGFISDPDVKNPNTETKAKAGVSKTLEYALDDYSLGVLAKALNDDKNANELLQRSKNYKNVFDPKTHFMRGKLADGSFINPFDSEYPYYEYMYREANAWQLSFYVPYDMPGLVNLYESEDAFESKLDSLFTFLWNPKHIARNVSGFLGQYCHGNQPDHEAPFAYYFINKPEKSQQIVDTLLKDYYGIGADGLALSGMDDAGEMSAWYVFAASGLYPLSPADNEYLISLPIFDRVMWNIGNSSLEITKTGTSRKLKQVKFNGTALDGYFLSQDQLTQGGSLKLETK
ncbi:MULTISPECIES: GH92 family glycosyl hydrolase [unclassified Leeuwenhoekiella]|uniref:GH92 family glycosyl hydrolase n=1 Tax=unclassified Leeuwenhoekiella TaxID=2615029 RepID=UPI0025BD39D7|nr:MULTISPECIES: GH92 family glycosyl hydrolase [unclassified Leeuwenhoekiella]|tara:strand:+ start:54963 stop:57149 length:2187 start_codon:yes stop_codon:yes gene_type:complete